MANTIQVKRSINGVVPATGTLAPGEIAWIDHDPATNATGDGTLGALYIGDMTSGGAVTRQIGGTVGSDYVTEILDDTTLTGNTTIGGNGGTESLKLMGANQINGAVTLPTVAQSVNDETAASTSYVQTAVLAGTAPISQASDTDIELTPNHADIATAGDFLVYTGTQGAGLWRNVSLTGGDVSMAIDSPGSGHTMTMQVTDVQNGAVDLATDVVGPFLSSVINTPNETKVTVVSGATGAEHGVQIGLDTNVDIAGHLTIAGDLTVSGTQTTVDTATVSIKDNVFVLGDATSAVGDRGIQYKYDVSGTPTTGYFGQDKATGDFVYRPDATGSNVDEHTGNLGGAQFSTVAGTLTTGSQPNITSLGVIGSGQWQGTAVGAQWGGTGLNTSTANGGNKHTGVPSISSGSWDVNAQLSPTLGGTGYADPAANSLLIGNGANAMTVLSAPNMGNASNAGMFLGMDADSNSATFGAPKWVQTVDGGTW